MVEANEALAAQGTALRNQARLADLRQRLELIRMDIEHPSGELSTPIPVELVPLFVELKLDLATLRTVLLSPYLAEHASSVCTEFLYHDATRFAVNGVNSQLRELARCLRLYDSIAGETDYTDYFRSKYSRLADAACELGLIEIETHWEISRRSALPKLPPAPQAEEWRTDKHRCSHPFHIGANTQRENAKARRKKERLKRGPHR